jgi:hypothetical protein
MPGIMIFQQRFDDRRRKMVAQCFANEQWDVLHSLLVRNPELAKPQQRPARSSTSSSSHTNRGGTGGVLQWGTDGSWTLLHLLVYQPSTPNDLIAYVAQLDDGAAGRCQNSIAETPLHLCCDRARPDWDRIRLLLRSSATTQQHADGLLLRDSFGRTSFFLACANNAPIDILQDFISINRRVVSVHDAFSDHPIECLSCRLYGGAGPQTTNEQVRQLHQLVDKLTLVAVEAWKLRPTCPWWDITRENSREYLLLAILHIKPSLLDVIIRVCCGGKSGHAAAAATTTTTTTATTTMRPLPILSSGCFWKRDAHGNLPLHVALRQPRTPGYALPELLRLAPGTAKIPTGDDGQLLPIHLAVRRQQQQEAAAGAVSSRCRPLLPFLLHAHPEALSQVVASTGLLPFQDAASRHDDVTVIYTLLRSKPDLLSQRRAIIKTPPSPSSSDRSSVTSSGYHSSSNKNQSTFSRGRCSI